MEPNIFLIVCGIILVVMFVFSLLKKAFTVAIIAGIICFLFPWLYNTVIASGMLG